MSIKGGDKLEAFLAKKIGKSETVSVGFYAESTEQDGTPVPLVAATMEYGGRVEVEPHETTIFRKVDKKGNFLNNGKFVRKDKANIETTHYVGAHVIDIPARPFFRPMIAACSPKWSEELGKILINNDYLIDKSLDQMGQRIAGQLVQSIQSVTNPPLAPSTIKRKGFDKPLIETGIMWQSVLSKVG